MRSRWISPKHVPVIILFSQLYIASTLLCLCKGDMRDTAHCVLRDERLVSLNLLHFKNGTELISRRSARCSASLSGMQSSPEFCGELRSLGRKWWSIEFPPKSDWKNIMHCRVIISLSDQGEQCKQPIFHAQDTHCYVKLSLVEKKWVQRVHQRGRESEAEDCSLAPFPEPTPFACVMGIIGCSTGFLCSSAALLPTDGPSSTQPVPLCFSSMPIWNPAFHDLGGSFLVALICNIWLALFSPA